MSCGEAQRRHASVHVEPGVEVVVEGKRDLQNGDPPQFQADAFALLLDGRYLHCKPVTVKALYRVPTDVLRDENASAPDLAAAVQAVATTLPTDGSMADRKQRLYLSDLDRHTFVRGSLQRMVMDPRLQWREAFS